MRNIGYLIGKIYKERKSLLVLLLMNTFIVSITPIFELKIQMFVINGLIEKVEINYLIKIILLLLLGLLILKVCVEYIKNEYENSIISFRMGLLRELQSKCLGMKYSLTEDSVILDKINVAKRVLCLI